MNDARWQREENFITLHKINTKFPKVTLVHASHQREIFENNVPLTLFYANLLQYKRLNIHI